VAVLDADHVVLVAGRVGHRLLLLIHLPLPVHFELVLKVSFAQINDSDEVFLALDHAYLVPLVEAAGEGDVLAASRPLDDARQPLARGVGPVLKRFLAWLWAPGLVVVLRGLGLEYLGAVVDHGRAVVLVRQHGAAAAAVLVAPLPRHAAGVVVAHAAFLCH